MVYSHRDIKNIISSHWLSSYSIFVHTEGTITSHGQNKCQVCKLSFPGTGHKTHMT